MEKRKYIPVELEVIELNEKDVIITSTTVETEWDYFGEGKTVTF